jgi:hypothetical protein
MVEGAAPQSHHRATVILGRGARDSWTAVGLAVTEALRVQVLGQGGPAVRSGSMVTRALDFEGEQIQVVDTTTFFEETRTGEGSADG